MNTHPTSSSYVIGFAACIALSLAAYQLVVSAVYSPAITAFLVVLCALAQLGVQLVCFLHVHRPEGRGWNLPVLIFAVVVVVILVGGTVWIMHALSDRMAPTPQDMEEYIQNE